MIAVTPTSPETGTDGPTLKAKASSEPVETPPQPVAQPLPPPPDVPGWAEQADFVREQLGGRQVTRFSNPAMGELGLRITGGERGIEIRARAGNAALHVLSESGTIDATIPLSCVTLADIVRYGEIGARASSEEIAFAFAPVDRPLAKLVKSTGALHQAQAAYRDLVDNDETPSQAPGIFVRELCRLIGGTILYNRFPDFLQALQTGTVMGDDVVALAGIVIFGFPLIKDAIDGLRASGGKISSGERMLRGGRMLLDAAILFEPTRLSLLASGVMSVCRLFGRAARAINTRLAKCDSDEALENLEQQAGRVDQATADSMRRELLVHDVAKAASTRTRARPGSGLLTRDEADRSLAEGVRSALRPISAVFDTKS